MTTSSQRQGQRPRLAWPLWAVLPLLVSCSVTPPGEINDLYRDTIEQRHSHYKIQPGDLVSIRLYSPQHKDLSLEQVHVLPDGRTDLFFMHDAHVAGKTVTEFEAELRARLSQEVRDPEISVQVEPVGDKVYMYGDFQKPAPLDMTVKMTLREAIAAVGGMRVTGDTDWALLRRPYLDPRHPDRFRIDLNDESEEVFLLPGDQVYLGKNAMGTVVNYIQEFITSIFPNPYFFASSFGAF